MDANILAKTIEDMVINGRGILAADESTPTMTKRLQSINVESTEETRRTFRNALFSTPNISDYISGVILFEETLGQKSLNGSTIPEALTEQGIVPGIKVDKGAISLSSSAQEKITQGLDGLSERLAMYREMGARFAKWRAVLPITHTFPSEYAVVANAQALARYASICQAENIVPIVEPELLMDGDHTIERCEEVTECTLHVVFHALYHNNVSLEHMVLKPNMVISGKDCKKQAGVEEVAERTVKVLRRTVPAAVPSINFLSGGQSDELATEHLNAMNHGRQHPWLLSFSYGRALQAPALKAWSGKDENITAAQEALFKRAKLNGAAVKGDYAQAMES